MANNDIWTIKAALEWTVSYLDRKSDSNPRLSAEWLIAEATGLSRIELYTNYERPLSLEERDVLRNYVTRRGQGEPLQYITGEVGFRHIAVKVRPGVLIPRPETEVLVSEALALLPAPERPCAFDSRIIDRPIQAVASDPSVRDNEDKLHDSLDDTVTEEQASELMNDGVLHKLVSVSLPIQNSPQLSVDESLLVADVCTGTGCIACSIAYEHPLARVIATDIASKAVSLARENVVALGLEERIQVLECDLGESIDPALMGQFDLVVSNPPYVPTAVMVEIPYEVANFEPALALDGGTDGLDTFRRLLTWCAIALKPGGAFAFELHETCLENAAKLAISAHFTDVRTSFDLAGRPRVLTGKRPLCS